MKSRSRLTAALLALLASGVLIWSRRVVFRPGDHLAPIACFEEPTIDRRSQFLLQGDPLICDAKIKNLGDHDLLVEDLPRSCGCMLLGTEEQEVHYPIRIARHSAFGFKLQISTEHRAGFHRFELGGVCRTAGDQRFELAPLSILASIRTRIVADPPEATLELSPFISSTTCRRVEIKLADNWEGAGIPVKAITCQTPGRLTIQDVPATGDLIVSGSDLKRRRSLWITSAVAGKAVTPFTETVTIHPADDRVGPTVVMIRGVVTLVHEVSPGSILVVSGRDARPAVRYVQFLCRDSEGHQVDSVDGPAGVTASLEASDAHRALIKLVIDPLRAGEAQREGVLAVGIKGAEWAEVPIKVVRGD